MSLFFLMSVPTVHPSNNLEKGDPLFSRCQIWDDQFFYLIPDLSRNLELVHVIVLLKRSGITFERVSEMSKRFEWMEKKILVGTLRVSAHWQSPPPPVSRIPPRHIYPSRTARDHHCRGPGRATQVLTGKYRVIEWLIIMRIKWGTENWQSCNYWAKLNRCVHLSSVTLRIKMADFLFQGWVLQTFLWVCSR